METPESIPASFIKNLNLRIIVNEFIERKNFN